MSANKAKGGLYTKFADKFGMADESELKRVLKSTCFKVKEGEVTDEQLYALLIVADEYGLNPFTREIFAYPDKQNGIVPVVSVDGWARIINQHPQFDGVEFIYDTNWVMDMAGAKPCPASITCVIFRKDRNHPTKIAEFLDEVFRPAFEGRDKNGNPYRKDGPWQSHTKRMLRHKTLIQCARIAFGFAGIYDEDEAIRIINGEDPADVVAADVSTTDNPTVAEASAKAQAVLSRVVARAKRENSWPTALEYVKSNFTGIDLNYLVAGIERAKEEAMALPDPQDVALPSQDGQAVDPNKLNGSGKSSPLAEARAALNN